MKAQEQRKPENNRSSESNPSMDEILQSIRGVINEDALEGQKSPLEVASEEVLELTEVVDNTSAPRLQNTEESGNITPDRKTDSIKVAGESATTSANETIKSTSESVVSPEVAVKASQILRNEESKIETKTTEDSMKLGSLSQSKQDVVQAQEMSVFKANDITKSESPIESREYMAKTNEPVSISAAAAQNIKPIEEKLPEPVASERMSNEKNLKQKNHLISEKVASEATTTIKELMNKATKPLADGFKFRSGATVEELVVETIKPYLSHWLDEHLPSIVKNLVEKEIKKLIPNED